MQLYLVPVMLGVISLPNLIAENVKKNWGHFHTQPYCGKRQKKLRFYTMAILAFLCFCVFFFVFFDEAWRLTQTSFLLVLYPLSFNNWFSEMFFSIYPDRYLTSWFKNFSKSSCQTNLHILKEAKKVIHVNLVSKHWLLNWFSDCLVELLWNILLNFFGGIRAVDPIILSKIFHKIFCKHSQILSFCFYWFVNCETRVS